MPIYSYAELKGKIKVGDKVRAAVGQVSWCDRLEDGVTGTVTGVGTISFEINGCTHSYADTSFLELLTEEKTLDTVDVGDVVVDEDGGERTILDTGKSGKVVLLSLVGKPTRMGGVYARQELEGLGYTVKQSTPEPEPKEMTLEEVSKALGYPVKIVE